MAMLLDDQACADGADVSVAGYAQMIRPSKFRRIAGPRFSGKYCTTRGSHQGYSRRI
jgi:hypothetical protein